MGQDAGQRADERWVVLRRQVRGELPASGAPILEACADSLTDLMVAAIDAAVAEAVAQYPVAEGDYALMRQRMQRAEEAVKERDERISRYVEAHEWNTRLIDELRLKADEARREERERLTPHLSWALKYLAHAYRRIAGTVYLQPRTLSEEMAGMEMAWQAAEGTLYSPLASAPEYLRTTLHGVKVKVLLDTEPER